jgi:hypothetical protein
MVISLSNECHVYANNGIVSFLYDRPECKPKGSGEHRCDVILIESSESKRLWIIECKGKVDSNAASKAINQIEKCLDVIRNVNGWEIKKCVIGNSYKQEAARLLANKKILHIEFKNSRTEEGMKNIVEAVKKIKGY